MMKNNTIIGTKWKCPHPGCDYECVITKSGIIHVAKGHFLIWSLNDLIALKEFEAEISYEFMFGKKEEK